MQKHEINPSLAEELEGLANDLPIEQESLKAQAEALTHAYIMNIKGAAVNCLLMSRITSADSPLAMKDKMAEAVKVYVHDLKLFIKSNFDRLIASVRDAEIAAMQQDFTNAKDSCSVSEAEPPSDDLSQE